MGPQGRADPAQGVWWGRGSCWRGRSPRCWGSSQKGHGKDEAFQGTGAGPHGEAGRPSLARNSRRSGRASRGQGEEEGRRDPGSRGQGPHCARVLAACFLSDPRKWWICSFLIQRSLLLCSTPKGLKRVAGRHEDPRSVRESGELRGDARPRWGHGRGPALGLGLPLLVPALPHDVGPVSHPLRASESPPWAGERWPTTPDPRLSESVHGSMQHGAQSTACESLLF